MTISLTLNNNGIIERAKIASETSKERQIKDEIAMAWGTVQIDGAIQGFRLALYL